VRFHGGATADLAAAARAVDALATPLGLDREATARGILRIANANMANALKLVSLNRGHDPRDFTLVAFGGGGALHAAELAQDLGCRRIVIPAEAAVFTNLSTSVKNPGIRPATNRLQRRALA